MRFDLKISVAILVAALPARALANPLDLYGFNPRALGMASANTAFADDFTAVYYNPAALTAAKSVGFGIGFYGARPSLKLHFEKEDRPINDLTPPSSDAITFGSLFPLGGEAFRNR